MANDERTLTELVKIAADLPVGDGTNRSVKHKLTQVIWSLALKGDRNCINLLWEALGDLPTQQDKQELSDDLTAFLDKVYGDSEGGEVPEGPG